MSLAANVTAFAMRRRAIGIEKRATRLEQSKEKLAKKLSKSEATSAKWAKAIAWIEDKVKTLRHEAHGLNRLADKLSSRRSSTSKSRATTGTSALSSLETLKFWRDRQPK